MLIIDDDESFVRKLQLMVRKQIREANEKLEIEWDVCENYMEGEDALRAVKSGKRQGYDLYIVDFKIPMGKRSAQGIREDDFLGLDLCSFIRQNFGESCYIPVSNLIAEVENANENEGNNVHIAAAQNKDLKRLAMMMVSKFKTPI